MAESSTKLPVKKEEPGGGHSWALQAWRPIESLPSIKISLSIQNPVKDKAYKLASFLIDNFICTRN